jgi:hypothetical protein
MRLFQRKKKRSIKKFLLSLFASISGILESGGRLFEDWIFSLYIKQLVN